MSRLFIYPKDIQILTGRSLQYAQKAFNSVLDAFGKEKKQGLTIKDYALYHGINEEEIIKALDPKNIKIQ